VVFKTAGELSPRGCYPVYLGGRVWDKLAAENPGLGQTGRWVLVAEVQVFV